MSETQTQTYSHKCIKCQAVYTDSDFDDYYCLTCNEQRKIVAKEVDEKLKGVVSKKASITGLKRYEAMPKTITRNSSQGGLATFIAMSDL